MKEGSGPKRSSPEQTANRSRQKTYRNLRLTHCTSFLHHHHHSGPIGSSPENSKLACCGANVQRRTLCKDDIFCYRGISSGTHWLLTAAAGDSPSPQCVLGIIDPVELDNDGHWTDSHPDWIGSNWNCNDNQNASRFYTSSYRPGPELELAGIVEWVRRWVSEWSWWRTAKATRRQWMT